VLATFGGWYDIHMEELLMVPLGQVEDISLVGGKAQALSQLIKSGLTYRQDLW
jgi:hypothetical protein